MPATFVRHRSRQRSAAAKIAVFGCANKKICCRSVEPDQWQPDRTRIYAASSVVKSRRSRAIWIIRQISAGWGHLDQGAVGTSSSKRRALYVAGPTWILRVTPVHGHFEDKDFLHGPPWEVCHAREPCAITRAN